MNRRRTVRSLRGLVAVAAVGLFLAPAAPAQTPAEIQAALDAAYAKDKDLQEGKNAGRPLTVDQEVFKSESDTNQRNQAIADVWNALGGNPLASKAR